MRAHKKQHDQKQSLRVISNIVVPEAAVLNVLETFRRVLGKTSMLESLFKRNCQVSSEEFCDIFKNTFFIEHFQATTSVVLKFIFKTFEKYP